MEATLSHITTVAPMSTEELQGYLAARTDDHIVYFLARMPADEAQAETIRLVNEEAAEFDNIGGWLAYCSCGWQGNNPHAGQDAAVNSVEEHKGHYEREAEEQADG